MCRDATSMEAASWAGQGWWIRGGGRVPIAHQAPRGAPVLVPGFSPPNPVGGRGGALSGQDADAPGGLKTLAAAPPLTGRTPQGLLLVLLSSRRVSSAARHQHDRCDPP